MKSREQRVEEQNRLLMLVPEVRWRLAHIPSVRNVGVGAKEVGGSITDEFAFRIYVDEKRPPDAIAPGEHIPPAIKHILTDVIVASASDVLADTSKRRPLKGGFQVKNEFVQGGDGDFLAGTLGCLAEVDIVTRDLVGLTCEHVIMAGQSNLTIKVGQPDYSTCCCCVCGQIGAVINSRKNDKVDCAIVHLDEDIRAEVVSGGTANLIEGFASPISGVAQAVCFEAVRKRGRTTGVTSGQVVDVIYESSQILIHPTGGAARFAERGDSGSVIVNGSDRVIGLLWATDVPTRTKGVANHIGEVMREMNIRIAGQTAAGLVLPTVGCASSSGP
jgi:hypothetical protein